MPIREYGNMRESAEAFFLRVNKADIHSLLTDKQMNLHQDQVRKKRQALERVIDIESYW